MLTPGEFEQKRAELERKGFSLSTIIAILAAIKAGQPIIAKLLELLAKKKA